MARKYQAPTEHYHELAATVTLAEAMRRWHVGRSTLRYAIDTGRVAARHTGREWLISVRSLNAVYRPKISR